MTRRALFLSNPRARHGRGATAAAAWLETHGYTLRRPASAGRRLDPSALRRELSSVDLVIAAGGDGTVNAAINALVGTELPLGLVPLGTANDLARTLAIPVAVEEACAVIAAGHTRAIDVSRVNGRYFCNVASIGLSVDLTRRLTGRGKRRWGVLAYPLAAVRSLRDLRHFHATIRTADQSFTSRTVQVAVGNGKYYGGGMVVAADATIDDHILHVYSLEVEHWWEVLLLLPALRHGSHIYWRRTRALTANAVTIETRRRRLVDVDGELAERTPAEFCLLPGALRVLCPAP